MKRYCRIESNVLISIEDEFIDIFPGIPITQRYSKDFIDKCVVIEDDTIELKTGMIYEDGIFEEAPEIIIEPTPNDPDFKPTPDASTLDERTKVLEETIMYLMLI